MIRPAASLLALVPSLLLGQEPTPPALPGRAFVPPEPRSEIRVDFRAMRDSEVWDGVSRSFVAGLLPMLEQELGFRLTDLDLLRGYLDTGSGPERNQTPLFVFEGSEDVVLPRGKSGTLEAEIGDYEVVVEAHPWIEDDPSVWVRPAPGTLVYGPRRRILPVLLGEQRPGVPPPELLSLSAGRGVLAYVVVTLQPPDQRMILELLAADGEAEGGTDGGAVPEPAYMMLRLRQQRAADGDEDDEPTVYLEGVLRWQDEGAAAMQAHLEQRIAALRQHPRFGALRVWWDRIELEADGRDLRMEIDMGQPRDAGAMLATLAPFMMFTTVRAEAVEIEEVPAAGRPRAEQGEGEGKGKGKAEGEGEGKGKGRHD